MQYPVNKLTIFNVELYNFQLAMAQIEDKRTEHN